MKALFDKVSVHCSKVITHSYSTSFSLGIRLLHPVLHHPIYAIYGFVRVADEIVDTFHGYDQSKLLDELKDEVYLAIDRKISTNPVLNAFQEVVHRYNIDMPLIDQFLYSMQMDLSLENCDRESFNQYVLGSAEVVGLMCLKVFVDGNQQQYDTLKPYAMKLGAAFQKINFLRDIKADYETLGRSYFPDVDLAQFDKVQKDIIEKEIKEDFEQGLYGIKHLPVKARLGVYVAYVYYQSLFRKIRRVAPERILNERIRISNPIKLLLLARSFILFKLGVI